MKKIQLALLFLLISVFSYSQSNSTSIKDDSKYIITGYLYDSSLNPLCGASIFVKNRKYGSTTDNEGFFKLKLPISYLKKNFSIKSAYVDYEIQTIEINNKRDPPKNNLIIHLKKRVYDPTETIIVD